MAKKENKFVGFFKGIVKFFKDVKNELKKVVWPSFKQVKNNTFVVIVCVLVVGAFIALLDMGFITGWSFANPPAYTVEEYKEVGVTYNRFARSFTVDATGEKIAESEADNKVETAKQNEAAAAEQEQARLEMYDAAGIKVDEKGQCVDKETGKVLTEEEITEKITAAFPELMGGAESTEGTEGAQGEETPDETNKDEKAE